MKQERAQDLTDRNILFYVSKEQAYSIYTILMIPWQYVKIALQE